MNYINKNTPWKHTLIENFIDEESKEKIYSDLRRKLRGFGNINLSLEEFATLSDETNELTMKYVKMIKDPEMSLRYDIKLTEDTQLLCQLIRLDPEFEFRIHSGAYTKTLTTYVDMTPKVLVGPDENYIHIFEQLEDEVPVEKTKESISFSPKLTNTTWHRYVNESKKHEKIICLFIITTAITDENQRKMNFDFEKWQKDGSLNDRRRISDGLLINKQDFVIYSKFKCGSTSLTEWYYTNFNDDDNYITTLRDSLELSKKIEIYNEVSQIPNHYIIHRDPYDRFFSGILQTKVLGLFDVYQERSSKTSVLLTLPFDLIREEDVVYIFEKLESYVPDFLTDKHLEPFYSSLFKHYKFLIDSGKNVKLIHLNDLNSLPSIISQTTGKPMPQIVRFDMRGKIYNHLDKKECKDKFFSIIFKNKNKVRIFNDIITMLSADSQEYLKMLEYDKKRITGL